MQQLVFSGSRFTVGESYDELLDTKTKHSYISQAASQNWGAPQSSGKESAYRDYGFLSSFHGPGGNTIVVISGTRDEGVRQTAEAATNAGKLQRAGAPGRHHATLRGTARGQCARRCQFERKSTARVQPIAGMPRFQNTLVGRLAILQFAIHLVLPPILYYRLDAMITKSASRTFTRHAHAYASALAHELELADVLQSPSRTVVFLDSIVQGGGCAYSAVEYGGRLLGSSSWKHRHGCSTRQRQVVR